jgi:hypothetical protein
MNKQKITLIGVMIVLIVVMAVTYSLSRADLDDRVELYNETEFVLKANGEDIVTYNLKELKEFGSVDFDANLKTNGKKAEKHSYTGISLKEIYDSLDVNYDDFSALQVSSVDGYVVMVDIKKLLEGDNVYLAYKRDGEIIASMEDGGKGPIQMIISKDKISQYWCKYALSADLKE